MYLLDTNHCSRIIQGNRTIIDRIAALGDIPIATCVIVQGEMVFMAENSQQRASNLELVRPFVQSLIVYPVDDQSADVYGALKAAILRHYGPRERSKRSKTRVWQLGISDNDLWIAAIALRNNLTVVSADSDVQRIQQVASVAFESWI
jgi:tRNA(fMet)-specific endonuclease VapC